MTGNPMIPDLAWMGIAPMCGCCMSVMEQTIRRGDNDEVEVFLSCPSKACERGGVRYWYPTIVLERVE